MPAMESAGIKNNEPTMLDIIQNKNVFIDIYEKDFIQAFRKYNDNVFELSILGLGKFLIEGNEILGALLERLKANDFIVRFEGSKESVDFLHVKYIDITDNVSKNINFQIENLLSIIELSSRTDIPLSCIIVMKVIAKLICQYKVLYKAIVLDLDDTLWPGTLSEDGIQKISENMHSAEATSYIAFMKFVKVLAKELGIFVAICSRNDQEQVRLAIDTLDGDVFPIKGQIDYIIANNNDKSDNILMIASQLSILPSSIVFIDDNPLIRDEVKRMLPGVCVPNWCNHYELMTQLIINCVFERFELSINSQDRRKQYKILQAAKMYNSLPELLIKVRDDSGHIQAKKLYSKSNQFKLISEQINYKEAKSLFFEICRTNGENLGICSAITYSDSNSSMCGILNWAISCRYFEIGLEEFIILYLLKNIPKKEIYFACQLNTGNQKVQEFINKYYGKIFLDSCDSLPVDSDTFIDYFKNEPYFKDLLLKLRNSKSEFCVYWLGTYSCCEELLKNNTNLKLI